VILTRRHRMKGNPPETAGFSWCRPAGIAARRDNQGCAKESAAIIAIRNFVDSRTTIVV